MYSFEGKRLVNQVLAKREQTVGSHLVLGLNTVYDASLDGSAVPTTHNRYHTPYVIDEINVANSSVISELNQRDRIVFSGQADNNKRYMANNIGLVAMRVGASVRTHRTFANVALETNWTGHTRLTPVCVFTNDGVLAISNDGVATYTNRISLDGYAENDIIAFPLSFHGGVPTGATVTLTINFLDGGVAKTCTYSAVLEYESAKYHFDFETSTRNDVSSLGTDDAPTPFVFQQRLGSGVGWTTNNLQNNLRNITGLSIALTTAPGITMRFGTVKITPDFESDLSRVTTAFRKLNTVLRKTDVEAYVNPEFTLLGVVI